MNRMIHKDFQNKECLVGVMETVNWISTKWCGGPKEEGEYLVSDGKGGVYTLYCTGANKRGLALFEGYLDHCFETIRFSNNVSLTSDELIQLCSQYHVWYRLDEYRDYDYDGTNLTIIREEDMPKYFMEPRLSGPIDSELETYDKVLVDPYRNIVTKKKEEA